MGFERVLNGCLIIVVDRIDCEILLLLYIIIMGGGGGVGVGGGGAMHSSLSASKCCGCGCAGGFASFAPHRCGVRRVGSNGYGSAASERCHFQESPRRKKCVSLGTQDNSCCIWAKHDKAKVNPNPGLCSLCCCEFRCDFDANASNTVSTCLIVRQRGPPHLGRSVGWWWGVVHDAWCGGWGE